MSISIPKTIIANGQTSTVFGISSVCCRIATNPAKTIITPMARITIAPPPGIPKHSSSCLLRIRSRSSLTGLSDAPHWEQTLASSGFLVPHLVQ